MLSLVAATLALAGCSGQEKATAPASADLSKIDNVVVIFGENRSFDNLYGLFPGANGIANSLKQENYKQLDRTGRHAPAFLPPAWGGLTGPGVTPVITEEMTERLPNVPFQINDPGGFNLGVNVRTRDLVHRFYQNQMQIDDGRNDKFVAYSDAGALVMGYYDGSKLPLWQIAKQYTLADNFFMGGFGGSFFNHIRLVCACSPYYPHADKSPAKDKIAVVNPDGVSLKIAANSPKSDLQGPPKFVNDGALTPDFYAVNTMQPPYQPSGVAPAPGGDPRFADPNDPHTLPPQTQKHIGDMLDSRKVSWAWYSGAWDAALADRSLIYKFPKPNFQAHHQPFNYFKDMAPGTEERKEHLKDEKDFLAAIKAGNLPAVSFYKPQGNLNQHSGYANVYDGDKHIADIIHKLQQSPQWKHMLIVVTYDENGGYWDHVSPPKGDRWGPGSRIPAIIVSPYAKRGFVDHQFYDTTSILRFITKRWQLPELKGLVIRDEALKANNSPALGDLTHALDLSDKS
ncbi:acid phosphatase [Gallaecimonas mangrovi]|uniref:acid phosphatase n=1 Tax=Gallaecimonas mangrovi TaxID=2291597 RepID=UPI001D01FEFF|nr:acid phosphatase [Gallaecimonas mangrovi]